MHLYHGPRDNEPRARQSTSTRGGGTGDGFRHKHQAQIQRGPAMQGAIKEGTRVANPTACAAFHPIHQSPLSQFPRSARAGKNEGGHVATKHRGRPKDSRFPPRSMPTPLADQQRQQAMPTESDPWGGSARPRCRNSPREIARGGREED